MGSAVGDSRPILVFDTGPLSAFAKAGMLGVLKTLARDSHCVMVDAVEVELHRGVPIVQVLQQVLDAEWLDHRVLGATAEVQAFVRYATRLIGASNRNRGETAVLAWTKCHPGATAVIDDGAARKLAREEGLMIRGSLRFLIDAVNDDLMAEGLASLIADELILNGARFPFKVGGFRSWAHEGDHIG